MQQHENLATFSFIKEINNAILDSLILKRQLYTLRYKNRNANKFFKKQIFTVFIM